MAVEIYYLTLDEVVGLHNWVLGEMGSPPSPLLHPYKLDSAIHRPQHLAHYEKADLIAQAVALAIGISQAQAFQDGNKRAAFVATDTFLEMNGISVRGDPMEFACWLICAAGKVSETDNDTVVEHLGLELAAGLDVMRREEVAALFEGWLRANSSISP